MWKLNNDTLTNKANSWTSNDKLKLIAINETESKYYIENTSNNLLLGIVASEFVIKYLCIN